MITMKNVRKSYDNGADALRGINLEVEDGEFVFIVGPSGSGKSTLTKILTGEIGCTDGEVMVNGFDLDRMRPSKLYKLRRTLGIIFQDFRLIENKTVYQNIEFAMRVLGVKPKKIKPRIKYVLELVGLQDKINCMPNELSGGEQQRVAIARALANNPRLIIADEPTGNIDPELSRELMALLVEINKKGTTILVVTHEEELVNEFTNRVVVINHGEVVRDGTGGYYGNV
ncbi:MAG: cell division ATP-binding protein FtsE [Oscillospiraceae bacterium]|nr:cell division ATP-binding protein FtsE [Oscillospiraceae bacterium]